MLDYLIRGGTVVDGTGRAPYRADLAVRGGRIVEIGTPNEGATTTLDAAGLLVTPGFIDPHTHYDAQLHWDAWATPSSQHGVTTVIAGNCGFTLAPLTDDDTLYTQRMMARVEGMPLAALQRGPSWDWHSFGEFLDRLDGEVAVNAGFMVGHCALRRFVLGADAVERPSTEDELETIAALLHESLSAGGLGLSLTRSYTHIDGDGRPVPSRLATEDEVLRLCDIVGRYDGTSLEAITDGCIGGFDDDGAELLAQMSARARRPLNWNLLAIASASSQHVANQLRPSVRARELGGRVVALSMPVPSDQCVTLGSYCIWWMAPGWNDVLSLPLAEKKARLADPAVRARLLESARRPEAGVGGSAARMGSYRFGTTNARENAGLEGRLVADVAIERGLDDLACVVAAAAAEDFDLDFWPVRPTDPDDDPSYRLRLWESPDVLLGGSDAGAHLDHLLGSPYPTRFLADVLRGSRLLPVERAVRLMSDVPARLFGLRDRGRLTPGGIADVAVFDPERVASGPAHRVHDLPGGAYRLLSESLGVVRVLVNGEEIICDGRPTGARPGTVLRSGRDTTGTTTS
ncbi:MAG TPA: amidohydrolase family protein [Acidimicrobiia bacterium]|nr:amidohydrolase family protein [Acidimicrobiia bacterium]